jgi:hypothetical protein
MEQLDDMVIHHIKPKKKLGVNQVVFFRDKGRGRRVLQFCSSLRGAHTVL